MLSLASERPERMFLSMQVSPTKKHAVFLDGPIGVGKTTYGRHLATEFAGHFLDGDDFSDHELPWFASSLSTNRGILKAIWAALDEDAVVFVAYPIRCINWIFFIRHLRSRQVETVFVGLQASLASIASEERTRQLSEAELTRSREMISQGYGSRTFYDLLIQTDIASESEVTKMTKLALEKWLGGAV